MQDSFVIPSMHVCRGIFTRNNIQEFYTLKECFALLQFPDKISVLVVNNAHSLILKTFNTCQYFFHCRQLQNYSDPDVMLNSSSILKNFQRGTR